MLSFGCSSTAAAPLHVAPAPPPTDDGKASEGGKGGDEHSAALELLRTAPGAYRDDKQGSVRLKLPDAEHWTRVKFWGVPSLVGFRYGKDHHAIAGAFITHVDDNTVRGACEKSFESWAKPWVQLFEVEIEQDPARSFVWRNAQTPKDPPSIVGLESVFAKTATLAARDTYAAAYALYPAWKGACLVVGVAIPSRNDEARARAARDHFVSEVFPSLEIMMKDEPKERY